MHFLLSKEIMLKLNYSIGVFCQLDVQYYCIIIALSIYSIMAQPLSFFIFPEIPKDPSRVYILHIQLTLWKPMSLKWIAM
jgi:hypothetical protein